MVMPNPAPQGTLEERMSRIEQALMICAECMDNLRQQINAVHEHSKTVNKKCDVILKIATTNKETTP